MNARLVLALAGALVPGLAAAWAGLGRLPRRVALPLAISLAAPLGLGLTSVVFFLWRLGGGASAGSLVALELALSAALVAFAVRATRAGPPHPRVPAEAGGNRPPAGIAAVGILALCALLVATVVAARTWSAHLEANPHGGWDAWAIWNMRARFLSDAEGWRRAFDPETTLPEYPVLLPASVARLRVLADAGTAGPAAIAGLFALSLPAIVAAGLFAVHGALAAAAGGLLVLALPHLASLSADQYADVPLAALVTAGVALLWLARHTGARGPAALGGLALGLAAWTKSEGTLFLLALAGAFAVAEWRARGLRGAIVTAGALAGGAAAGVAALVPFRLLLAQPGYLFISGVGPTLARAVEADRWAVIGSAYWIELSALGDGTWVPGGLAVAALAVAGLRGFGGFGRPGGAGAPGADPAPKPGAGFIAVALVGVLAAEALVYALTPFPLVWQLGASLSRLYAQLWPPAVLALLLATRTDAGSATAGPSIAGSATAAPSSAGSATAGPSIASSATAEPPPSR